MTIPRRAYRLLLNRHAGTPGVVVLPEGGFRRAKEEIASWPGYAPTPLPPLPEVATGARVAAIHWKDEGGALRPRQLQGAGRGLCGDEAAAGRACPAAAWRMRPPPRQLAEGEYKDATGGITVTCATDGNHGRSVAWGAQRFGARCVIFVHETVSQGRRDAIAAYGAEIRVVPGTYDDAVRAAQRTAEAEAWFVVSDTSYPGYTEVPRDVMQGYRLMAEEATEAWPGEPPTHAFIQGGVGGVAAAVSVQLRARYGAKAPRSWWWWSPTRPRPACWPAPRPASPPPSSGDLDTLMAGLACGEPSLLAWQELERAAFAYLAVPDAAAVDCMTLLAKRDAEGSSPAKAGSPASPACCWPRATPSAVPRSGWRRTAASCCSAPRGPPTRRSTRS